MKKQKSIFKEWWFYLMIIVVIIFIYILIPKTGANTGLDTFAKCLTEKEAVMYGTEWCGHCQKQKETFGKSFKHINYVDCDRTKEKCLAALITGYPTWKIKGQNYPGQQSLQTLASLTGCELVKDN